MIFYFIDRTNALQGKSFVISGVFKNHSRDELKSLIDKNSGKNTSSISKKTSYLIAGENIGPANVKKRKIRNSIISEDEFLSLLRGFLTDIKHWYGAWQLRRSDIEMRRKHQAFNIDSAKRITILFDGTEPEDIKLVKAFVGKLSNGKMVSALGFVDQKDKSFEHM